MGLKYGDGSYDICIIGSGPVGLTLCAEFASTGKRICVLESGHMKTTEYGNALRQVQNLGEIAIKPSSRERVLGGASTTWGGGSAPMDDIDMEYRPYLTHPSGWPISVADLTPYYARTAAYGFPSLDMFRDSENKGTLAAASERLEGKRFIASDPPWDFGKKLQWIFYNPNIDLYLNATVLSLRSERDANGAVTATQAHIRSSDGTDHAISAKIFIIATGGIESARLLLLSRDTDPKGLGNEHDQVGRYLMNHPKNNFGLFRLNGSRQELPYPYGNSKSGWNGYTGIRLTDDVQRSAGILNSYFRLEPVFPWTGNKGVEALLTLVKSRPSDQSQFDLAWTIATHLPMVLAYAAHHLSGKKIWRAKAAQLRNFMEMEPLPENRLTLASECDANGQPLPAIQMSTSPLDRHSLIELHRIFAEEMKNNNIGTLESGLEKAEPWPITADASHHLGGARMGNDPQTSVVTSDLQVHSVNNLYVCGGAVFPTSGCVNPTYTMCALAIRLADTLKEKMGAEKSPASNSIPKSASRKNIIVIGAGKRVQADILPAIEASGKFEISGVYAQTARRIYVGPRHYDVSALESLSEDCIKKTDWIYIGIPVGRVSSVLQFLSKFDTSTIGLIIDTPVFPRKYLGNKKYFTNFKRVVAAEDAAYLPWINPVREFVGGELSTMIFDRSAYSYHGMALIKTLMNNAPITGARLKNHQGKAAVEIVFSTPGKKTIIIEPRDYKKGTFILSGPSGSITDDLSSTATPKIRPIIAEGLCVGLDIAGTRLEFTRIQSELIGFVPDDATITSLTLELKRVGLVTLLSGLVDNPAQIRGINLALDDTRLDERIHSFGKWFNAA